VAGISIDLSGDKALLKKFATLGVSVEKKVLRKALRKGGKPVLAKAKQLVPVDKGLLKRSLKLRAIKRSRREFGVRVMTGTREELGIPASDPYYYPAAVELGHRRAPPHSFLRAAMIQTEGTATAIIKREIARGVELEWNKR
jgi:HK97 gp10 family phage protein